MGVWGWMGGLVEKWVDRINIGEEQGRVGGAGAERSGAGRVRGQQYRVRGRSG